MDPNIKKELARFKAQQDITENEARRIAKLQEMEDKFGYDMKLEREKSRLRGIENNPFGTMGAPDDEGVNLD